MSEDAVGPDQAGASGPPPPGATGTAPPSTPSPGRFVARDRRNLLVDGVLSRLMDNLAGGVFLAGLALAAGASNLELGLLAALPFAAQAAQWPVAKALLRRPGRKAFTVAAATASRLLLLAVALVALLGDLRAPWLLGLLAASTVLAMVSSVAWNWWMRDLVPHDELGRYFGKRLWAASLAGMAATLAAALVADRIGAQGVAWVFATGAAFGLLGMVFLGGVGHPPTRPATGPLPRLLGKGAPGEARLAGTMALVAATLGFALPFVAVFLLRGLGLSLVAATIVALVSSLGNLLSLKGWGHLSDRHGHRPVLLMALGMLAAALLVLGLLPPAPLWLAVGLVALAHFLSGYAVGGIDLASANLALRAAPADHAPLFLARIGLAKATAGGLAAVAAGALWQAVGTTAVVDLAPGAPDWPLVGFQVLALVAAALAVVALLVARRLPEPQGKALREVAVAMRREARQMSSVAGIRAFVHTVSYVVEAVAQPPFGKRRRGRRPGEPSPGPPS